MSESLDSALCFLMHDVARLLRKRFEQPARELALTRAQWQVLAHVVRHEGIHQSALADMLEIEPITLVRLIDHLGAGDWIERRQHPTDRHVRQVFLREKACPVLDHMWRLAALTRAEALAGVPADQQEQFTQTLTAMRANLLDSPEGSAAEQTADHG
jgi:DNA-binding MarR family transcriptional regulator